MGSFKEAFISEICDTEAAWLAGILEGEGSFLLSPNSKTSRIPRITICSSDRDVVDKVAKILRTNVVPNKLSPGALGKKEQWRTSLARRTDVLYTLKLIYPYMGIRRKSQIDKLNLYYKEFVS